MALSFAGELMALIKRIARRRTAFREQVGHDAIPEKKTGHEEKRTATRNGLQDAAAGTTEATQKKQTCQDNGARTNHGVRTGGLRRH